MSSDKAAVACEEATVDTNEAIAVRGSRTQMHFYLKQSNMTDSVNTNGKILCLIESVGA